MCMSRFYEFNDIAKLFFLGLVQLAVRPDVERVQRIPIRCAEDPIHANLRFAEPQKVRGEGQHLDLEAHEEPDGVDNALLGSLLLVELDQNGRQPGLLQSVQVELEG